MNTTGSPWPIADRVTAPFWDAVGQHRLILQRCLECGEFQHYPRPFCISCMSERIEWVEASGRGRIHSMTVSRRQAHQAFAHSIPLVVALVDLEEGVRMMTNIVGSGALESRIEDDVEVVFVEVEEGIVLPRFQLVQPPEGEE